MSIIQHVTLQIIVAHDFRYDPRISGTLSPIKLLEVTAQCLKQCFDAALLISQWM